MPLNGFGIGTPPQQSAGKMRAVMSHSYIRNKLFGVFDGVGLVMRIVFLAMGILLSIFLVSYFLDSHKEEDRRVEIELFLRQELGDTAYADYVMLRDGIQKTLK